jgi:hypothetical protein
VPWWPNFAEAITTGVLLAVRGPVLVPAALAAAPATVDALLAE